MTIRTRAQVPATAGWRAGRWLGSVVHVVTEAARDRRYQRLLAAALVLPSAVWVSSHASPHLAAAPYLILGGAIAWLRPELALVALLLVAAFVPFKIGTGTGSAIDATMLAVAGVTGFWLVRMAIGRRLRLLPSEANLPWLALTLVAGASILAGSALWDVRVIVKSNFSMVQLAQWAVFGLSACAFWVAGNLVPSRRTLELLTRAVLAVGALLLVAMAVPDLPALPGRLLSRGPIFRIWFVALAAAWALFRPDLGAWRRWLLGLAAIAMIGLSLRTGSGWQSGWLPPLVTLVALVAVRLGRGFTVRAGLAGGLLASPLAVYVVPQSAIADLWSLQTRLLAWKGLWAMMPGRWLFGLGLAAYWHYWRDVIGYFAYLDPTTGWLHYTYEPQVNMHSTYVDVFAQMGLVGVVVVVWLIAALVGHMVRDFAAEREAFGRAYIAACAGGLAGMLFAGLLADWVFPFVYNVGLAGFRDSFIGWFVLGGLVALRATRPAEAT